MHTGTRQVRRPDYSQTNLPTRLQPSCRRLQHRNSDTKRPPSLDAKLRHASLRDDTRARVWTQPVDVYSCYWELRLDCFAGRRCEVGVCLGSAVTSSGLDKARAWYVDCWGRKVRSVS
jgi:hypothetical protein